MKQILIITLLLHMYAKICNLNNLLNLLNTNERIICSKTICYINTKYCCNYERFKRSLK